MRLRVLHLVGSSVSEFYGDVSLLYARDCLEATADAARYEVHLAYVTPDGRWRFPDDLSQEAITSARSMALGDAVQTITSRQIDVLVPQMFCVPGMTSYRALFDVLRIPYVGNTAEVMALGSDKAKARAVVCAAGVPVPAAELLRPGMRPSLDPPVVVKPVHADNSLGLSLVTDRAQYDEALASAFAHSDEVLAETYIELGREVRCGIVVRDGELVALPLEEYNVDSIEKPIRDHADKLQRGIDGDLQLVAKDGARSWILAPEDPLTTRVWDVARTCHVALGARHYSLFDFRIDPDGNPWFLEAGLYRSFARKSVLSVMAHAAGIPVEELFATALREVRR